MIGKDIELREVGILKKILWVMGRFMLIIFISAGVLNRLEAADGDLNWAKRAGGGDYDRGYGIASCSDGSSIVTGTFCGTATFGEGEPGETGLTSAGSYDIFVAKYNPDGTLAWAKRAGGEDWARGYGIASYSDGSSVVTGLFSGTATFGEGEPGETGLTSAGYYDIFVAKYNPDGTVAWAKRAGGGSYDYGKGIASCSDGSSIMTGTFCGTATFGEGEAGETGLTSAGSYDIFVAKYNPDGTLAWAKRAGGESHDYGYGIASCSDGSSVVTGFFNGTAIFGEGEPGETSLTSAGDWDIFVAKYNSDGTLVWAKRAGGGSGDDRGHGIASCSDGSSIVTGTFCGTATFGEGEPGETGLTSAGYYDIFVAKYNSDGTLAWAKHAGGESSDYGHGIASYSDGSGVVTGSFYGTATFGEGEPGETSLTVGGGSGIFVAKYNPDGTLTWAKRAGGGDLDVGYGIASCSDGSSVATGWFYGTATFGEGEPGETSLTSAGGCDIFVAKYHCSLPPTPTPTATPTGPTPTPGIPTPVPTAVIPTPIPTATETPAAPIPTPTPFDSPTPTCYKSPTPTPSASPTPFDSPTPTPGSSEQQSLNLGPFTVYADYISVGESWPKTASGNVSFNHLVIAAGDIMIAREGGDDGVYKISGNCLLYIEDITGWGTVDLYEGEFSYEVDVNGLILDSINYAAKYLEPIVGLEFHINSIIFLEDGVELSATLDLGGSKTNINTATKDELDQLPGIGSDPAQGIIDYREEHGAFWRPENIKNVFGIGDAEYEAIEDRISVDFVDVGRFRITRNEGLEFWGKMSMAGFDIQIQDLEITSSKISLNQGMIIFPELFKPDTTGMKGIGFSPASRSYCPINSSCSDFNFKVDPGEELKGEGNVECSNGVPERRMRQWKLEGHVDDGGVKHKGDIVVLLSRLTGKKEEVIDVFVVEENGHYEFPGLPSGDYQVRAGERVTALIEGLEISADGISLEEAWIKNIPGFEYAGVGFLVEEEGGLCFSTDPYLTIELHNTLVSIPAAYGNGSILLEYLRLTEEGVDVVGAVEGFSFTIPGTGFKVIIEEIYFDTINEIYGGMAKLKIPSFPDVVIGFRFHGDEIDWVHAEAQGINRPIFEVIFLQRIGLDINNLASGPPPVVIVGEVGLSAGPAWDIPPPIDESIVLLAADPIAVTIDTSDYVELSGEMTLFQPSCGTMTGNISFLLWDIDYVFSGFDVLQTLAGLSQSKGFYAKADLNIIDILIGSADFNIDLNWNVSGGGTGSLTVPSDVPVIGGLKLGGFESVLTNNYLTGEAWISRLLSVAAKFNFDGKIEFGNNLEELGKTYVPASVLLSLATGGKKAASAIEVSSGIERLIFRFAWTEEADTDVTLISPTGEEITPADAPIESSYANYLKDEGSREAWYIVKDPEGGLWEYQLTNWEVGDLTVQLLEIEEPPGVEMLAPGVSALARRLSEEDSLRLSWDVENLSGDEIISLYYDEDDEGYAGSLIASGDFASQGYYDWVIDDSVPSGRYFIYAIINNGRSMPRGSYMPGVVTVENTNAPDSPRNVKLEPTAGKVTVSWDANEESDLLAYVIEWTDDLEAIKFDHRLAVGPATSYTLEQLDNGRTYKIRVKAVDVEGNESLPSPSRLVKVEIEGANHPPRITSQPPTEARPGTLYRYQVTACDEDEGDILTYSLVESPGAMTIDGSAGLIQWMPQVSDVGRARVEVKVKDQLLSEDSQEYYLDVYNDYIANIPPEIISTPPGTAELGQEYIYLLEVSDVDGDELSYSLAVAPEGMTLDSDGRLRWTPTEENAAGENLAEIKVTDGRGGEDTQCFTIFIEWFHDFNAEVQAIWLDPAVITSGSRADVRAQFKNLSPGEGPYGGAVTSDVRIIVIKPDGSSSYHYIEDWSFEKDEVKNLSWNDYNFDLSGKYRITAQIYDLQGRQSNWSWLRRFDSRSEEFTIEPTATATPTPIPSPTPSPSPSLTPYSPLPILASGDYDGDGRSDIAIFRRSSGLWAVRGITRIYFGAGSDIPVSGDYDGDGTSDISIFRNTSGLWAVRNVSRCYFGSSSDIAVPGDYNGDGCCDVGIFREANGLWAIRGVTRAYFGASGDIPVPGYYDGEITKDIGIFRPSSGLWALRNISRIYFGSFNDIRIPGDYNGDGTWAPGIFRADSGLWAIRGVTRSYFGSFSDIPVPADYDGSGTDDIGIFRPAEAGGLWAVRGVTRAYYGAAGDIPVTR